MASEIVQLKYQRRGIRIIPLILPLSHLSRLGRSEGATATPSATFAQSVAVSSKIG